jgi:hypothetical protein
MAIHACERSYAWNELGVQPRSERRLTGAAWGGGVVVPAWQSEGGDDGDGRETKGPPERGAEGRGLARETAGGVGVELGREDHGQDGGAERAADL